MFVNHRICEYVLEHQGIAILNEFILLLLEGIGKRTKHHTQVFYSSKDTQYCKLHSRMEQIIMVEIKYLKYI